MLYKSKKGLALSLSKGFTLIELLVVISILGVLTALIMGNFGAARERARDVSRKSDLNQIKTALRMYYNDHNLYPLSDILIWGNPFNDPDGDGTMVYMKVLPHDPSYDATSGLPEYSYTSATGIDFCLRAVLENESDRDISNSHERCDASSCGSDLADNEYAVCPD